MLEDIVFLIALAATCLLAFRHGGRDERLTALTLVVAAFATPLVVHRAYAGPELGLILVDVVLLAWLLHVAKRSQSFWPLWMSGFHLATLAVHVAAALLPHMKPLAYADALTIWAYLMLATLAYGSVKEAPYVRSGFPRVARSREV